MQRYEFQASGDAATPGPLTVAGANVGALPILLLYRTSI
jgi:hypothetical protein